MTVLRVYDPFECDDRGVPLDWERCRWCEGTGSLHGPGMGQRGEFACKGCDGHGSLKSAARVALAVKSYPRGDIVEPVRCEDCGHPMSEGTWCLMSGDPYSGLAEFAAEFEAQEMESWAADDPGRGAPCVHYSPCDEGCRHGGRGTRIPPDHPPCSSPAVATVAEAVVYHPLEATWRQVDVRTLGWQHDLRPERLAMLCLRCWAART